MLSRKQKRPRVGTCPTGQFPPLVAMDRERDGEREGWWEPKANVGYFLTGVNSSQQLLPSGDFGGFFERRGDMEEG